MSIRPTISYVPGKGENTREERRDRGVVVAQAEQNNNRASEIDVRISPFPLGSG